MELQLAILTRSKFQASLSVIVPQLSLPIMTNHVCRAFSIEVQSTDPTDAMNGNRNQKIHINTRRKKINNELQVKKSSNSSYCEAHTCFGLSKFPSAKFLIAEESLKRVQWIKLLRKSLQGAISSTIKLLALNGKHQYKNAPLDYYRNVTRVYYSV